MVETGGWGGIAHYAWSLCAALADAGAEVWLLTNAAYELDDLPRIGDRPLGLPPGVELPGKARIESVGIAGRDVVLVETLGGVERPGR